MVRDCARSGSCDKETTSIVISTMGTLILLYTKAHRGTSDLLAMVNRLKLPVELLNADAVEVRDWMISRSITSTAPSIIDLQPDGEVGLIQGLTDCHAFLQEKFKELMQPGEAEDEVDDDPYAAMQPQTNPIGYQPMVNAFTTTKSNIEPSVRMGPRRDSNKEMSIMERAKQMNKERDDSMVVQPPPFS